jgi:hypothetical protein
MFLPHFEIGDGEHVVFAGGGRQVEQRKRSLFIGSRRSDGNVTDEAIASTFSCKVPSNRTTIGVE